MTTTPCLAHPTVAAGDAPGGVATIGSLFSGYGGLDMAVEAVTGARPAWFVEFDAAPSTILARHWPDVPNYGDVTKVNWHEVPPVDIITGGSPCQDLSAAGKRAGMTEGTRSNLWVNMREAINIIRPRLVVWENVLGALSAKATSDSDLEPGTRPVGNPASGHLRALGRVCGDLSEIGYDTEWATLRASDVGAPHNRARVFLIAYPSGHRPSFCHPGHDAGRPEQRGEHEVPPVGTRESGEDAADPAGVGPGEHVEPFVGGVPAATRGGGADAAADADSQRRGEGAEQPVASPPEVAAPVGGGNPHGSAHAGAHNYAVDFGPYDGAVRRWERLTRPAPAPTELNRNGKPRLAARFAEWMMGLPDGHVTAVPGLTRANQLKAIGNGVCPQQAAAALQHLLAAAH